MASESKDQSLNAQASPESSAALAPGDLLLGEEDFSRLLLPDAMKVGAGLGAGGEGGRAGLQGSSAASALALAADRGITLSEDQARAAEPENGRTAIVATAGAGKTMTIAARVAALSLQLGDEGERQIFATSFTREASRNLKERVNFFLGRDSHATISTLHSLCARLVMDNYRLLGFTTRPSILTTSSADMRLKSVILSQLGIKKIKEVEDFNLDELNHWCYAIDVASFSLDGSAADSGVLLPGFELLPMVKAIHRDYHRSNRELGHIDYDEIMTFALELLRSTHKNLLRLPRHIFVDEAQDLNAIQWYIIDELAASADSLVIIGDDDQSVYSWRGARPSKFVAYVRSADRKHQMSKNRRCAAAIVALSEAVVSTIPKERRVEKKLSAERLDSGEVYQITSANYSDFIKTAPSRIQAQIGKSSKSYDDFAFLFRSSGMAFRQLQGAFLAAKIPFVVRGGKGIFDEDEALYLKSFVTLASRLPAGFVSMEGEQEEGTREKMIYWRELMAALGVSDDAHDRMTAEASEKGGSLEDLRQIVSASRLRRDNKAAVLDNIEAVQAVRLQLAGNQNMTLREMLTSSPILRYVQKIVLVAGVKAAETRRKKGGVSEARAEEIAGELAQDREEGLLAAVEPLCDFRLREASERFELDDSLRTGSHRKYPKIVISTAHSAKGLEWDKVYIIDAVDGAWPSLRSEEKDAGKGKSGYQLLSDERRLEGEDEEKRLFYVAVTRAKNTLSLVNGLDMWQGRGSGASVMPARYLPPEIKRRAQALMNSASHQRGQVVVGRLTEALLPKPPGAAPVATPAPPPSASATPAAANAGNAGSDANASSSKTDASQRLSSSGFVRR